MQLSWERIALPRQRAEYISIYEGQSQCAHLIICYTHMHTPAYPCLCMHSAFRPGLFRFRSGQPGAFIVRSWSEDGVLPAGVLADMAAEEYTASTTRPLSAYLIDLIKSCPFRRCLQTSPAVSLHCSLASER